MIKNYRKVKYHNHYTGKYRGAAHNICTLNKVEIFMWFSTVYSDYHVIIKYLKKVFEGKFDCLEENTEKCKTFSVTIIT